MNYDIAWVIGRAVGVCGGISCDGVIVRYMTNLSAPLPSEWVEVRVVLDDTLFNRGVRVVVGCYGLFCVWALFEHNRY